jgi:hypothetical protein
VKGYGRRSDPLLPGSGSAAAGHPARLRAPCGTPPPDPARSSKRRDGSWAFATVLLDLDAARSRCRRAFEEPTLRRCGPVGGPHRSFAPSRRRCRRDPVLLLDPVSPRCRTSSPGVVQRSPSVVSITGESTPGRRCGCPPLRPSDRGCQRPIMVRPRGFPPPRRLPPPWRREDVAPRFRPWGSPSFPRSTSCAFPGCHPALRSSLPYVAARSRSLGRAVGASSPPPGSPGGVHRVPSLLALGPSREVAFPSRALDLQGLLHVRARGSRPRCRVRGLVAPLGLGAAP